MKRVTVHKVYVKTALYSQTRIVAHIHQGIFPSFFDNGPRLIDIILLCSGCADSKADTKHSSHQRLRQRKVRTGLKVTVKCLIEHIYTGELVSAVRRSRQKPEHSQCERGRGHELEDSTGADALSKRIVQRNALHIKFLNAQGGRGTRDDDSPCECMLETLRRRNCAARTRA